MTAAKRLAQRRFLLCMRIGHPQVVDVCFGYVTCARCNAQLGDNLGGAGVDLSSHVVVGHDCEACRKNARALRPSDRWLLPAEARASV